MVGCQFVATEFQEISSLFPTHINAVAGRILTGDFLYGPLHNVGVISAGKAFIRADNEIADLLHRSRRKEGAGEAWGYGRSPAQKFSDFFSIGTGAVCLFFCFAQAGSGYHLHCFCDLLDVGDRLNAPFYITRTFQSDHPSFFSDFSSDSAAL